MRRNEARFPEDFAFQLTPEELDNLKSQFATSSGQWGGRRKLPYAFTEHGALMAASVLNSPKAVEMSILVVRSLALDYGYAIRLQIHESPAMLRPWSRAG